MINELKVEGFKQQMTKLIVISTELYDRRK